MSLEKVIWAEGVFLGQQHFQLWDEYLETCQRFRNAWLTPFAWGLVSLSFDEDALLNARFRVIHCRAIMPNGQLVDYHEQADKPLCCLLQSKTGEKSEIFLSIPISNSIKGINGYLETSNTPTWHAEYQQIKDKFDVAREREVLMAKLNLVLLQSQDSKEQFITLKIAEVMHNGNDEYQLIKEYIPPLLCFHTSIFLKGILRRIIELITAKIRMISDRCLQIASDITEFGQSDLAIFLISNTLNSSLPLLQHYYSVKVTHPEKIYMQLVKLIGELTCCNHAFSVTDITQYDHRNLSHTFTALESMLIKLLNTVIPYRIIKLKLERESDTLYSIDNIDSELFENCTFLIEVNCDGDKQEWANQFSRQIKVASRSVLESIVASALPGVKVIHAQRLPTKLPIKTSCEYFYLEKKGAFWEQVKNERTLSIFLPQLFTNTDLEILTLRE